MIFFYLKKFAKKNKITYNIHHLFLRRVINIKKIWTSILVFIILFSGTKKGYARLVSVETLKTNPAYTTKNPYTLAGFYGQCTWYAWGRMYEKTGFALPSRMGNAGQWFDNISSDYKSNEIKPNSIMVIGAPHTLGHVIFIEEIQGSYAYITEGNANGSGTISGYKESVVNLDNLRIGSSYQNSGKILGFITSTPKKQEPFVPKGSIQNLKEKFIGRIIPKFYPSYALGSNETVINSYIKLTKYEEKNDDLKWLFQRNSDGSYIIKNFQSNIYLSVNNSNNLVLNNTKTKWQIFDYNGGYRFVPISQINGIDIIEGNAYEGQKLQLHNAMTENNSAQTFQIELLDETLSYETLGKEWMTSFNNGFSGSTGKGIGLTKIKINLLNQINEGDLLYRTHIKNIGWEPSWKKNGLTSGSDNKKTIEAIQIKLTHELEKKYDIYYRTHVQNFGWLGWSKNGESAGTTGYGYQIEALEIKLVKKGEFLKENNNESFKEKNLVDITYKSHIENIGWQTSKKNGEISGTIGKGLRLESMQINILNSPYSGKIKYRSHIQNIGWESSWKTNSLNTGTIKKGLSIEAIQMKLIGKIAEHYDIYYRTHVQNFGWLGWAKNGESAGTKGYGYQMEAIQIKLVKKGSPPPKNTTNIYREIYI